MVRAEVSASPAAEVFGVYLGGDKVGGVPFLDRCERRYPVIKVFNIVIVVPSGALGDVPPVCPLQFSFFLLGYWLVSDGETGGQGGFVCEWLYRLGFEGALRTASLDVNGGHHVVVL